MSAVFPERFDEYVETLHGYPPYPWQRRLAMRAAEGSWPEAIDLPTGSGKTACLDIAVFALACQASRPARGRNAPRRMFFCVNRRVIVDEAYQRARRIAEQIWGAENGTGILADVAAALRAVGGTTERHDLPPLDALELRGGIYRDNRWARSITQPTIVCTTLDQLGSRLLFRGYGVSASAAPIHAALIAYDSLILLDEAHISEPFRQTLDWVTNYLDPARWAERAIGVNPVMVVPMTATPPTELGSDELIRLDDEDRAIPSLYQRLQASKPARLREVKDVARAAVDAALEATGDGPTAVAIMVNRVATARAIYDKVRGAQLPSPGRKESIPPDAVVELVIGSMRPIDRDDQTRRLRPLVGPDRPTPASERTSIVVATQCLEVGADYDFDVLISECASLDALRQRFGRLNRAGRDIRGHAVILAGGKDVKPDDKLDDEKPLDPIYGNAAARTWNWLNAHASNIADDGRSATEIDFGIEAFERLPREQGRDAAPPPALLSPSASLDAPVMMPAYLDLWCQTAPQPVPDPDVSLFIHGPGGGEPDVQVCWRADLVDDERMKPDKHWCDVVALMPPTSAECMRVPISRMRRWLNRSDDPDDTGDVIGQLPPDADGTQGDEKSRPVRAAVLWRGLRESTLLTSAGDLRPGDTLVLPGGETAQELGHLPELYDKNKDEPSAEPSADRFPGVRDHAEAASRRARDRAALRLHPALRDRLGAEFADLITAAERSSGDPVRHEEWRAGCATIAAALGEEHPLRHTLEHLAGSGLHVERYPDNRGVVITSLRRLHSTRDWFLPATDDGEDETSRVERREPVLLANHTRHVVAAVRRALSVLPTDLPAADIELAARLHDLGKADERFQAMLRRGNRTDAWLLAGVTRVPWAKSEGVPQTSAERKAARNRAGLPDGFRHEILSAQLAEHCGGVPPDAEARDLLLHLIAAHHGHARPFAPVVSDDEMPGVTVEGFVLSPEQRAALIPPHRVDSGIAERFWRLTRRYGWWGLAYIEAVLRLADQQASADEDAGRFSEAGVPESSGVAA